MAISILPADVCRAVSLLLRAFDYADDAQIDSWQFAVEFRELCDAGLSTLDLRWLLSRGLVEHALEITIPGDAQRSFRKLPPTSLPAEARVVLTSPGAAELRLVATHNASDRQPLSTEIDAAPEVGRPVQSILARIQPESAKDNTIALPAPRPTPVWDRNLRELHFCGRLVKKYRVPAANQELILSALQEENWPEWIDDPLPPAAQIAPKKRLQATINSLNRNQVAPTLRFHVNHNGQIVSWEPLNALLGERSST